MGMEMETPQPPDWPGWASGLIVTTELSDSDREFLVELLEDKANAKGRAVAVYFDGSGFRLVEDCKTPVRYG